jgi:hypothetical protein
MDLAQYVGLASYVVLVWDHIDTFADEVSMVYTCQTLVLDSLRLN